MELKKAFSRLGRCLGFGPSADDFDEELQFHLEKEIERNKAAGMSAMEARRHALIAFGGVQQTRERVKEVYWRHCWAVLLQDVRYGLRMLRKSPGFTVVSVLILALGIGMNTAIFSLMDAVLFRALPVHNPQSLMLMHWQAHGEPKHLSYTSSGECSNEMRSEGQRDGCSFSLPFLRAAQSQAHAFSDLAGFSVAPQFAMSGNGPAVIINTGQLVSGNYFETLGVRAEIGRILTPSDDTPSAAPAVMIGYGYWQSVFGGDATVVGRTVRLNGTPFTIVGVVERGFDALVAMEKWDVWLPLSAARLLKPDWEPRHLQENYWWLIVAGRLKPGVSPAQAQAEIDHLYRNQVVHDATPVFEESNEPRATIVSAQHGLEGQRRNQVLPPLYVLLLAVGLILLIACANVAGLLLARAAFRQREIAMRFMLGARRTRVLLQLLIESAILSFLGGAAGLILAHWGARTMATTLGVITGGAQLNPHLGARVLLFNASASVLTGIFFGLLPALRSLRVDLTPALKAGSSGSAGNAPRNRWYSLANSLVVGQIALAMVALVAAGLLIHSFRSLKSADLGFEPSRILTFGIDAKSAGYGNAQADALDQEFQERFAALPGVASVSYSWRPLLGGGLWTESFHQQGTAERATMETDYLPVGHGFFKTMGIPMQAGRDFTTQDFAAAIAATSKPGQVEAAAPQPVIVNETFVRRYLGNVNPLGQHIEAAAPDNPGEHREPGWQVVGVVRDAKYYQAQREVQPTVYAPSTGGEVFFEIRAQADPKLLLGSVRDVVTQKDPNLALFSISTQQERVDSGLGAPRVLAQLSGLFGILALLLACMGVYGLLSYEVTRRTREIGIRMAVGALQQNVVRMVMVRALVLTAIGAVLGTGVSFAAGGLLQSLLYGVRPGDPGTVAGVAVVLLLVAMAACYLPARRATRIDPLIALRYE
jgi:predicted permease